jgi:hypothetical protein
LYLCTTGNSQAGEEDNSKGLHDVFVVVVVVVVVVVDVVVDAVVQMEI